MLCNLAVDLDERFDEAARAAAIARIETAGLTVEEREGADDRTLAWIDLVFGGTWSSESFAGTNVIARRGDDPVGFATYDARGLRFRWLRGTGTQPGVGIFGPIGIVQEIRGGEIGSALLAVALCGLRRRGYETALIPAVGEDGLLRYYQRTARARVVERFERSHWFARRYRTVVMASGRGSNFAAVADAVREGRLPLNLVAVIANAPRAGVIERARAANVHAVEVDWKRGEETRANYDERLRNALLEFEPELLLLLGWMHLLNARFVASFPEMLNLHPAFLPLDAAHDEVGMPDGTRIPAFRGPHAVRDAIAAGSGWIGASVHRVTAQTDRGPVLVRVPLQLEAREEEEHAYERLRPIERALVPRGIMRWVYER
ncbi:MAG TPA: formyltransferase family protein [Candidatus Tyrphobacter sp.]